MGATLEFQLQSLKVDKMTAKADHPENPANTHCELYHTWQLAEVPPAEPEAGETKSTYLLRQGYSRLGGIGGAKKLTEGDEVTDYNEPKFSCTLPALKRNERVQYAITVHHWEQDRSDNTKLVKTMFTDPAVSTLSSLVDTQGALDQQRKEEIQKLVNSSRRSFTDLMQVLATLNAPALLGVAVVPQLVEVVVWAAQALRGQDDYWDADQLMVQVVRRGSGLQWRVSSWESDDLEWRGLDESMHVTLRTESPSGHAVIRCTYRIRLLA